MLTVLRTVKIKVEGTTFCFNRPTALEDANVRVAVAQVFSREEDPEMYKDLSEIYVNFLCQYLQEIRDVELENENEEVVVTTVTDRDSLRFIVSSIAFDTLGKLAGEFLKALRPSEPEKKS